MQSVILPYSESKDLQLILDLARRFQIPFRIEEIEPELESLETLTIRQRLTEKYVNTGEWERMNDDERQDAALLEKMLWSEDQPDFEIVSIEESQSFLTKLRQGAL